MEASPCLRKSASTGLNRDYRRRLRDGSVCSKNPPVTSPIWIIHWRSIRKRWKPPRFPFPDHRDADGLMSCPTRPTLFKPVAIHQLVRRPTTKGGMEVIRVTLPFGHMLRTTTPSESCMSTGPASELMARMT